MKTAPINTASNKLESYPTSAKFFHWSIALIIFLNLIIGVVLVNFYSFIK